MANLLSKIQIGGVLYDLKDAQARADLLKLAEDLTNGLAGKVGTTGVYADDAAIKAAIEAGDKANKDYVDAQVGAINKFDVRVLGESEELPTAAADTMYVLYLKPDTNAEAGVYIEYITIRSGEEGAYTYVWEAIGSTKTSLADYATKAELAEAVDPINERLGQLGDLANKNEAALDLKALAHKDEATGTVEGQTITGVKATGTAVNGVTLTDTANEKDLSAAGKFTPAGNVTGTTVAAGKVDITITNTAADATITRGDYQPAGTVAVALSGGEFNQITSVGTAAQFTEGEFTPATLDKEDVTANYATEGIVGTVEGETLTFTAAGIGALTATKVNGFTGGSKAADTWVANTPATMESHNVGVQSATFTGEVAAELKVNNVSYQKHDTATAVFTGEASDISATFAGTEGDVAVAGKYTDTTYAAETTTGAIELAVGDIAVAAKEVTVR